MTDTPTFTIEGWYWQRGFHHVIGVDEVGRGALAGPVVAGAAALRVSSIRYQVSGKKHNDILHNTLYIIPDTILSLGIDDSKRVSAKQREALVPYIRRYFHCTVAEASVGEINRYGIVEATRKAMRRTIRKLVFSMQYVVSGMKQNGTIPNTKYKIPNTKSGSFLLLDGGFPLPHCPGFPLARQQAIVRGDQTSITIAAASIIAKVHRDSVMTGLSDMYVSYRWEKNKGYGTQPHRDAIQQYGRTPLHRLDFL